MSEWLKEHAWKACVGETLPWVRIPLSPPSSFARVGIQRELRRDGVADTMRSRRSAAREGGRLPLSPPSSFARVGIQRELRRDGVADTMRSRRSAAREGGRIPLSPPTFAKRSLRSRLRLARRVRRAVAK